MLLSACSNGSATADAPTASTGVPPAIVVILRLVVPLSMFRWPVGGMFAAIMADNIDTVLIRVIGPGTLESHTLADKLLDTYLLTLFLFFSLRWKDSTARFTSVALFSYRMIGVIVLSITGDRSLLFIFLNLFEFFFIYQSVTMKWWPHLQVNGFRRLTLVLPILLVPKLVQEYILHVSEFNLMCWLYMNTLEFTEPYLWSGFKGWC